MQRFTEGLRESYRLVVLLAFLVVSAGISATVFVGPDTNVAAAAGDPSTFMPEPVMMEPVSRTATAPYSVGATTIRLRGRL
ncbi:MAG: hypothetical protein WD830_10560, partial [Chloroflexota bacterium]